MSLKRVLINGLFIKPGRVGGAEQYLNNLLLEFSKTSQVEFTLLLNKKYKGKYHSVVNAFSVRYVDVRIGGRVYDYFLVFFVNLKSYDVIFSPNYITPLFTGRTNVRLVTVIHDLQYLHFPENFALVKKVFLFISHLYTLLKADSVLTISDFVLDDIRMKFKGIGRKKLQRIYNAVDVSKYNESTKPKDTGRYILSVCAMYPHKNLITLLKAYKLFKQRINDTVSLILVGQLPINLAGGDFQKYGLSLEQEIESTEGIKFTGFITDKDLGGYYKNCSVFVTASLFEGFGMTPIEALLLDKYVVSTKCGSLLEVTGGYATYVDNPYDEVELSNKIYDTYQLSMDSDNLVDEDFKEKFKTTVVSSQYISVFCYE